MVKLAVRLKHVHMFRKGKQTYVYFRKGATQVRIRCAPDDVAGIKAEAERIERDLAARKPLEASRFDPGTLGWLIWGYKRSDWWTGLKPATQTSYNRAFDAMELLKRRPIKAFDRPGILRLRDEAWMPAYGRWLANMTVTVLGILLKYAKDKGHVTVNPLAEKVRKIRAPKGLPQKNRPWTAAERQAVLDAAAPHLRLGLALAMCTGLRKADLLALTMADIKDGEVAVVTSKRDHPVRLPIHPLLASALAGRKGPELGKVCVGADGESFTSSGFDTIWHRLKKRLEKDGKIGPGLTIHGLRHTLGTLLKEAGAADGDIADVLGQSTVAMARHYSRNAALPGEIRNRIVALRIGSER